MRWREDAVKFVGGKGPRMCVAEVTRGGCADYFGGRESLGNCYRCNEMIGMPLECESESEAGAGMLYAK